VKREKLVHMRKELFITLSTSTVHTIETPAFPSVNKNTRNRSPTVGSALRDGQKWMGSSGAFGDHDFLKTSRACDQGPAIVVVLEKEKKTFCYTDPTA
jgi:hypothetical protein